ncbi:MAG: hypothetical protein EXQ74_07505, partial [Thermoleophilia bacterium]|nr:hypothetical protein [Thermoleophilia bacterium]
MKVSSLRIVVALAASALTAFASVAAAAPAPRVVSANGYRPASGPARGTIVVTARVSYRGVVRAADLRVRDASGTPLATGAVTLTAGGRTVIARDTVRLQPYAHRGRTAYFYFRFPASMARLLPRTGTLRPAFHFGVAGG